MLIFKISKMSYIYYDFPFFNNPNFVFCAAVTAPEEWKPYSNILTELLGIRPTKRSFQIPQHQEKPWPEDPTRPHPGF
jgi:hypothetical protein